MRPRVSTLALVLALSATLAVPAQQPALPQLAFDVVSIRPNRSSAVEGRINVSPSGRVEWTNTTLKGLLRLAYMRHAFDAREIVGGPSWINSDGFVVIATAESLPKPDRMDFLAALVSMVRALVEDRFRVQVHNEQRDTDIYGLVLARGDRKIGAALRSVSDACPEAMKAMTDRTSRSGPPPCSFGGPPGTLIGTGVTMTMFANVLSTVSA